MSSRLSIRKFVAAREDSISSITLWGDGSPTREFLYVADVAGGIVLAAARYDSSEPVNLGNAEEISNKDLAELIGGKIGFKGRILWDNSRPNGKDRRKLDISRAKLGFGFVSSVSFRMVWIGLSLGGSS